MTIFQQRNYACRLGYLYEELTIESLQVTFHSYQLSQSVYKCDLLIPISSTKSPWPYITASQHSIKWLESKIWIVRYPSPLVGCHCASSFISSSIITGFYFCDPWQASRRNSKGVYCDKYCTLVCQTLHSFLHHHEECFDGI